MTKLRTVYWDRTTHGSAVADIKYGREYDRFCPICGKQAQTKYFDSVQQKWVYKHPNRFAASKYCKADK